MTLPQPNFTGQAAIAFSGGGDSAAMLHAFRNHPHINHAFIVDHALRAGSEAEAKTAAAYARWLGYQVQIKRWSHGGMTSGIQAKARQYRYKALGEMCRQLGLAHLITAHTADDQAETLILRLERKTGWRGLAGMADSAFAPLWPALAGMTLHRPWLSVSRQALRDYNAQHGVEFVDDPSNENSDFARVRARQSLSVDPVLRADLLAAQLQYRQRLLDERARLSDWLQTHALISDQNYVLTSAVPPLALLPHILTAVAGTAGPVDRTKRQDLTKRMALSGFKAATLAGAWCVKTDDGFVFTRDRVAVTGRQAQSGLRASPLRKGETRLWDGRFHIEAKVEDLTVEPAFGHLEAFKQEADMKGIFDHPAPVRATLPVFRKGEKWVGFGALDTDFLSVRSTAAQRLHNDGLGRESLLSKP